MVRSGLNLCQIGALVQKDYRIQERHPWEGFILLIVPPFLVFMSVISDFQCHKSNPFELIARFAAPIVPGDLNLFGEIYYAGDGIPTSFIDALKREVYPSSLERHRGNEGSLRELMHKTIVEERSANVTGLLFNRVKDNPGTMILDYVLIRDGGHESLTDWNKPYDSTKPQLMWSVYRALGGLKSRSKIAPYLRNSPSYGQMDQEFIRGTSLTSTDTNSIQMLISFVNIFVIAQAATKAATEHQKGSKELLRIMGVHDWVYWMAKLIFHTLLDSLPHAFLIMGIFFMKPKFRACAELGDVYLSMALLHLLFFYTSSLLFTFILCTLLPKKPFVASVVAMLVRIVTISAKNLFRSGDTRLSLVKILLPYAPMWSGTRVFNHMVTGNQFLLIYLPVWSAYFFILIYLDAVVPWQKGTPKPWCFPFQFCTGPSRSNELLEGQSDDHDEMIVSEPVSSKNRATVVCENVCKSYHVLGQEKFVVSNLSLKIHANQLTILLGSNGAGKTTLMSMITGFVRPTSGSIYVEGFSLRANITQVRANVSLCTQHNLQFEDLTVVQHLELCGQLRGLKDAKLDYAVTQSLVGIQMQDKREEFVEKLSGGMRRRLQLAMAIVTDAPVIILDEPTSGLDPEIRRKVWDYLKKAKKNRTILLSTHSMEEAEAIGDRILIMDDGHLMCAGSPLFLKSHLGLGYSLRIAKQSSFRKDVTLNVVKKHFPMATISVGESSEEIIICLNVWSREEAEAQPAIKVPPKSTSVENLKQQPKSGETLKQQPSSGETLKQQPSSGENLKQSGPEEKLKHQSNSGEKSKQDKSDQVVEKLANMCDELDANKSPFGIASYGISVSTLDDVFMSVATRFRSKTDKLVTFKQIEEAKNAEFAELYSFSRPECCPLVPRQLYGLLIKRIQWFKRDYNRFLFLWAVSCLLILAFATSGGIGDDLGRVYPQRVISPSLYEEGPKKVLFSHTGSDSPLLDCYQQIHEGFGRPVVVTRENWRDFLSVFSPNDIATTFLYGLAIDGETRVTLLYDSSSTYSQAISLKVYMDTLNCFAGYRDEVIIRDHPLKNIPGSTDIVVKYLVPIWIEAAVFQMWVIACYGYLGAFFYLFPAVESVSKAKLVQMMTGLGKCIYWLSNYAFDYVLYVIFSLPLILIVSTQFTASEEDFAVLFTLILLSGVPLLSISYIVSYLQMDPDKGFERLASGYFYSFVFIVIILFIVSIFTSYALVIANIIANIFPLMVIGLGFERVQALGAFRKFCQLIENEPLYKGTVQDSSSFACRIFYSREFASDELGVIKVYYFGLLLVNVFSVLATIYCQTILRCIYRLLQSKSSRLTLQEDEDVATERARMTDLRRRNSLDMDALVSFDLTKDFNTDCCRSFRAVDHLTFGVHRNECFGLLGTNGAGKSTTFAMLTTDLVPTEGDAFINGLSLRHDGAEYRQQTSYCPQTDTLLGKLNPEETLILFARLKGMSSRRARKTTKQLLYATNLVECRTTLNANLSGGNKRKLSLAIATMGAPEVMFLDEPTTGVDPASRRKIWALLVNLRESGKSSIVLSSHSMDECESLCSRIAIMVRGAFRCLGSSTYLKSKFGQGFTLIIKLSSDEKSTTAALNADIGRTFPHSVLLDHHGSILNYQLPDPNLKWGQMYRSMGEMKKRHPIDTFTISDTSIEQIFIGFAKAQNSEFGQWN